MGRISDKVKTLSFFKGSFMTPDTVSFSPFGALPGLDRIPDNLEGGIPTNIVLPAGTQTESSHHVLIRYSNGQSSTSMHKIWTNPTSVFQPQSVVGAQPVKTPEIFKFEGHGSERTAYTSPSGEQYEIMGTFWGESFATRSPDQSFSGIPYALVQNPPPVIKNHNVTYFSVNGKTKQVVDYKHDIKTGICTIKYKKFRKN